MRTCACMHICTHVYMHVCVCGGGCTCSLDCVISQRMYTDDNQHLHMNAQCTHVRMQVNGGSPGAEGERGHDRTDQVQRVGGGGAVSPVMVSPLKMGRNKPYHAQGDSVVGHIGRGEGRQKLQASSRRVEGDASGRGSRGIKDDDAGRRRRAVKVLTFLDPESWSDEVRLCLYVCLRVCMCVCGACAHEQADQGRYEYAHAIVKCTYLPACLHVTDKFKADAEGGDAPPQASASLAL